MCYQSIKLLTFEEGLPVARNKIADFVNAYNFFSMYALSKTKRRQTS